MISCWREPPNERLVPCLEYVAIQSITAVSVYMHRYLYCHRFRDFEGAAGNTKNWLWSAHTLDGEVGRKLGVSARKGRSVGLSLGQIGSIHQSTFVIDLINHCGNSLD